MIPITPKILTVTPKVSINPAKLAQPQAIISAASIAKQVEQVAPKAIPDQADILLDSAEAAFSPNGTIPEKLLAIEGLLAAEELPIARLKAGLQDVMQCLKDNEGSILELEPQDIKLIVASYTSLADQEVQNIVTGKKKITAKKKKTAAVKELTEIAGKTNLDEVDF